MIDAAWCIVDNQSWTAAADGIKRQLVYSMVMYLFDANTLGDEHRCRGSWTVALVISTEASGMHIKMWRWRSLIERWCNT